MKLLLAKPNKSVYTETFIEDHIQYLKPDTVLYGGWKPYLYGNDQSIFSGLLSVNLIRGLIKKLLPSWYKKLYTKHLTTWLLHNKFDIVFCEYGVLGAEVTAAAKAANIPLVAMFHGFDAYVDSFLKRYQSQYRQLFAYAKAIIAVSNDMKMQLVNLGCEEHKIARIPYGVAVDEGCNIKSHAHEDQRILFIGRFIEKKSPMTLIKAFKRVLVEFPNAKLYLGGEGELLEQCKKMCLNENIHNVYFLGRLSRDEVKEQMRKSTLYVQHSVRASDGDSEGTPVAILEAAAAGLPVISTLHTGIKEAVIHEKTGLLCQEHDMEQMALNIIFLLKDKALAKAMGEEAKRHIQTNYEKTKQLENIRQLILSLHKN